MRSHHPYKTKIQRGRPYGLDTAYSTLLGFGLIFSGMVLPTHGAVFEQADESDIGILNGTVVASESFDSDAAGWTSFGLSSFAFDPTTGNLGGSLSGELTPGIFTQTGGFEATTNASSGNFTGNYTLLGVTQLTFDFLSNDVLPSDLVFGLGNSSIEFVYTLDPLEGSVGSWTSYQVPISYSGDWASGSEAQFNTLLTDVEYAYVEFTSTGTGDQTYFLDNFTLLSGTGTGTTAVPEPGTFLLVALFGSTLFAFRRYFLLPGSESFAGGSTEPSTP